MSFLDLSADAPDQLGGPTCEGCLHIYHLQLALHALDYIGETLYC